MTGWQRYRARLGKLLVLAVLVVVVVLGVRYARATDWPAVAAALRGYGPARLAACFGVVLLSYLLYCGYELVARHQVGHRLSPRRTAAIAFVCYAVALNLGALLGSGGMRLRLYTRAGLRPGQVARIAGFAVLTNWLGYAALAGVVLLATSVSLPPGAGDRSAWRVFGAVMLLLVAAYLVLCARYGCRHLHLRGQAFAVPGLRMAMLQLALSCANWAALGMLLYLLLPSGVDYPRVLAIVLLAAMAGVLLHTPAGLGAWESMFLLTLGAKLGAPAIVAALLAFRGLYYLLPLGTAGFVYLWLESRRIRLPAAAGD